MVEAVIDAAADLAVVVDGKFPLEIIGEILEEIEIVGLDDCDVEGVAPSESEGVGV